MDQEHGSIRPRGPDFHPQRTWEHVVVDGTRSLVPPHQKGGVAQLATVAFLSLHDYVVAHSACICAAALRCAHTYGMGVSLDDDLAVQADDSASTAGDAAQGDDHAGRGGMWPGWRVRMT